MGSEIFIDHSSPFNHHYPLPLSAGHYTTTKKKFHPSLRQLPGSAQFDDTFSTMPSPNSSSTSLYSDSSNIHGHSMRTPTPPNLEPDANTFMAPSIQHPQQPRSWPSHSSPHIDQQQQQLHLSLQPYAVDAPTLPPISQITHYHPYLQQSYQPPSNRLGTQHHPRSQFQYYQHGQFNQSPPLVSSPPAHYSQTLMMMNTYPVTQNIQAGARHIPQSQLQHQNIISEPFVPVTPELANKPPRRRRRPPYSYSSLIAQAILAAPEQKMTLRDIYRWIMEKYPALYKADDTGWQNTIRHNLSLNKCFKKIPRTEPSSSSADSTTTKGKGGYWTIDPSNMDQFTNGTFPRGSLPKRKTVESESGDAETTNTPFNSRQSTDLGSPNAEEEADDQDSDRFSPRRDSTSSDEDALDDENEGLTDKVLSSSDPLYGKSISEETESTAPAMQIRNLLN